MPRIASLTLDCMRPRTTDALLGRTPPSASLAEDGMSMIRHYDADADTLVIEIPGQTGVRTPACTP